MQLEQQFVLDAAPAQAWPAFKDMPLLVECLPGASLTGEAADGRWPLRFDVKLGPIAAGFVGTGQAEFDDSSHSGRFEGAATDRRTQSRVKGAASFSLAAEGDGSRVTVRVDYSLTGSLAQLGRSSIVRELAGALTAQFAASLADRLRSSTSTEPQASTAATTTAPAAAAPGPAPLQASGLLWQVLRARWHQFCNWLLRRPAG